MSEEPIRVLCSNNGLVLCSDAFVYQKGYYVCNPLTKRWVTIPPPPSSELKWARIGFHCYDNNNISSTTTSIIPSCSFVIVRILVIVPIPGYGEEGKPSVVETMDIYSYETGRWAECDISVCWKKFEGFMICSTCSPFRLKCSGFKYAVACKGLLHWRGCGCVFVYKPSPPPLDHNNKQCGQYSCVLQLSDKGHRAYERYLGESKGNLLCISFDMNLTFNVWELINYDGDSNMKGYRGGGK